MHVDACVFVCALVLNASIGSSSLFIVEMREDRAMQKKNKTTKKNKRINLLLD